MSGSPSSLGRIGQNIISLYNEFGTLHPRNPFLTIQSAIDAAGPNNLIVLSDGIYTGRGQLQPEPAGRARRQRGPVADDPQ